MFINSLKWLAKILAVLALLAGIGVFALHYGVPSLLATSGFVAMTTALCLNHKLKTPVGLVVGVLIFIGGMSI